ncbi:hypothetical protein PENTCL1PPCAC_19602, partial [Pristionchus entomophagus]
MKLAAFTLLVAMIGLTEAKMQNVTVKGIAICDKHRMNNVLVELWEKDTLDPNDLLASVHTNHNGEFTLKGGDDEITAIQPYIKFKHHCKVSIKPDQVCTRKTEYDVPAQYINGEYSRKKSIISSYVTLDIVAAGEKEKCEKIKN